MGGSRLENLLSSLNDVKKLRHSFTQPLKTLSQYFFSPKYFSFALLHIKTRWWEIDLKF